jgi:hypothetical protein
MCLGCAFILLAASFPRLGIIIVWAFTNWVQRAFNGSVLWPILGLIFLPFATLFFILVEVSSAGSVSVGGWILVGLGALLDIMHWAQITANRENAQSLYGQYGPGGAGA